MKCAIMQPTYLPWAGYFSMIDSVDTFVFFDDVQFARRSWQQRNRILFNGKEKMLTVPVIKAGKREQKINEVEYVDESWKYQHKEIIRQAYKKYPFYKDIELIIEKTFQVDTGKLKDININFITLIMEYLDIKTKILFSSELEVTGKKSQYLLNICLDINANTYLSAPGSVEYILEEKNFLKSPVKLEEFVFQPIEYIQKGEDHFTSYLSILDVIANLGKIGTIEYLKNNKEFKEIR